MPNNASGQSFGGRLVRSLVPPAVEMGAYDALPEPLRAALRDAKLEWPAVSFREALERGKTVTQLVQRVHDFEVEHVPDVDKA